MLWPADEKKLRLGWILNQQLDDDGDFFLICRKLQEHRVSLNNAVLKAFSNSRSEEYRRRFRLKRRGVSPCPTSWWASWFLWCNLLDIFAA